MPGGCSPSSPIGFAGLGKVYVGCSDGAVYQIDLASGTIDASKSLRPGSTMGDPTLDTENNILIVGSTNSRVYAIKIPF
jgi:outer membrane protein assembly factor BamB